MEHQILETKTVLSVNTIFRCVKQFTTILLWPKEGILKNVREVKYMEMNCVYSLLLISKQQWIFIALLLWIKMFYKCFCVIIPTLLILMHPLGLKFLNYKYSSGRGGTFEKEFWSSLF